MNSSSNSSNCGGVYIDELVGVTGTSCAPLRTSGSDVMQRACALVGYEALPSSMQIRLMAWRGWVKMK